MNSLTELVDRISFRSKLISLVLINIALIVTVFSFAYWGETMMNIALGRQVATSSVLRQQMTADMMHDGTKGNVLNALYLGSRGGDAEKRKAVVEKFGEDRDTMLKSFSALEASDISPDSEAALKQARTDADLYLKMAEGIVNKAFSDTRAAEAELPAFMHQFAVLETSMAAVGDAIEKDISSVAADAEASSHRAGAFLFVSSLVGVLLMLIYSVLIFRSITRQLGGEPSYAADVANRIASGDLSVEVHVAANDHSSLIHAMSRMAKSLTQVVMEIKGATDSISTGTSEIASGNSDLSSRTEQQASSLEETASAMEELTSTVRQNAENAKQANQLAAGASEVAVKGGSVVRQVVDTMSGISASSKKIADIIGVIDGIAFQTNILALNAAVEAARAGEQGRGFAVVASEVRNLAQRSAAAAKEIKELITDSVSKVDAGTQLVDRAGSTMDEIVQAVKRVTDIMAEISVASQEQSSGIDQVSDAVSQMDEVTQQNAALVEEAAAAAESLEEQAQKLAQAVSTFRLAGDLAGQIAHGATGHRSPRHATNVAHLPTRPVAKPAVEHKHTEPARSRKVANSDDEWTEF